MNPATLHMIRRVVTWVVVAGLVVYMIRQSRKPHGWLGRSLLMSMNHRHSELTDWGLGHIDIREDATILDVGCGGGRTLQKLAARASRGRLSGVDFSQASVDATRAMNAGVIGEGRMEVRHASVSHLPFDDATFDLVTGVETHYYWPDLPRDLAEVRRVLKPGGTAVLIAEVYRHRGSGLEAFALKLMSGATLTPEEHRAALAAAGFGEVRVETDEGRGWICAIGRNVPIAAGGVSAPAGARDDVATSGAPR